MDVKRFHHCVSPVTGITPDEDDGFGRPGPACVCRRCDRCPQTEDAMFVPDDCE